MTGRFSFPGRRSFLLIWAGQMVSLLGSGLTSFALGVWIYQRTDSVLLLGLNMFAYALPQVLLSPLAGALVDRWDRRMAMIVGDAGAGLAVLAVALLYLSGGLAPWNVYICTALLSSFVTLQWPAWSAATTLLVPKQHLGRASGMVQSADAVATLAAPAIAGALYTRTGVGVLVIADAASYLIAIFLMIFLVRVPRPPRSVESRQAPGSLWADMKVGWSFIAARPGLLGLLLFFTVDNFLSTMLMPLLQSMILDGWSPEVFGLASSSMGLGMLAGTLVMSAWGGPRWKIYGLLGAGALGGLALSLAGLRPSIPLIASACRPWLGAARLFGRSRCRPNCRAGFSRSGAPLHGRVLPWHSSLPDRSPMGCSSRCWLKAESSPPPWAVSWVSGRGEGSAFKSSCSGS